MALVVTCTQAQVQPVSALTGALQRNVRMALERRARPSASSRADASSSAQSATLVFPLGATSARSPTRLSAGSPALRREAFRQAAFWRGHALSILGVVESPGWRLPYVSAPPVGLGLLLRFGAALGRGTARAAGLHDYSAPTASPYASAAAG